MGAADADDLAFHGDDGETEDVVGGDAVFKAVRAAGVHADIATDHAGELAGGVWGVEEAVFGDGLCDADIGDASLDDCVAVLVIDFDDVVEAHEADDHSILERKRPAGEGRAGTARDHADAVCVTVAHDGSHLLWRGRQGDRHRGLPVRGKAVGLVGAQPDRVGDDGVSRQQGAQAGDDIVPAGKDFGFWGPAGGSFMCLGASEGK